MVKQDVWICLCTETLMINFLSDSDTDELPHRIFRRLWCVVFE